MIHFNKVTKKYKNDIVAIEDVEFKAEDGEFFFVVGPSGAGKSTLIRLLIREEFPTEGNILFEDIDVTRIPRKMLSLYRQQLGVVFQDLKLIPSKTVEENVQFVLEIARKPKAEIIETSWYLLKLVGLDKRAKLFPEELSGGEMQRTAIARALANNPKLFIADEPTGNLDPNTSLEILELLKMINSWGTTVMVVSHDTKIVDAMNTRVIRMEDGKIVEDAKKSKYENGNTKNKKGLTIMIEKDKEAIQNKKEISKRSVSKKDTKIKSTKES
ncbi:ATP-binding cassette domain-containing protein [Candidatus Nomurabacteria bacterium]|uniref:ATP-binding cassette domain-containing protein n=1 Tax=Candidatus Dojkabacteria bacterium TaxID=2099670 RepID=A0A955I2R8_9BACT|nr:ATP-binding cassette domain-containing protein [Candidatus Dojkabacteria bacterium]MCB9790213.1 ATP-binding cassette domain-containing protein [Candidatus Nomurabacteria bacterium]MCB9803267.1 ATP-binding cassette domain-containing protein [Candidatus Nomurabacteria bacterium]